MKITCLFASLVLLGAATQAIGQEDGSAILLPLEAQTCNLPAAPARIADNASYDDLLKAKDNVATFQGQLSTYRECLDRSKQALDLTEGNQIALNQAHNYSVEMEERVAEQFNAAVRAYKARQ
jgi:hypothetical protein